MENQDYEDRDEQRRKQLNINKTKKKKDYVDKEVRKQKVNFKNYLREVREREILEDEEY